MKNALTSHWLFIILILLFGVMGISALFHPGLYTAHDIWHQVARYYHYSQALREGNIFPMWVSQLAFGYGYPLFIFSYHFPWMVGTPLLWLGLDHFTGLKILFGAGFIAAGLLMYAFMHRVTKNKIASAVASIVYLWSPYHFLSLFVSASIGTVFAFFLLPALLLGVQLILEKKTRLGIVITAVSVAALIQTHLITLVLVLPFVLAWLLIVLFQQSQVHQIPVFSRQSINSGLHLFGGILLGFLLSAFYLIPFFTYLPQINANEAGRGFTDIYKSSVVSFKQLLYSRWGYSPITSSAKDGEISFQVGIAQWMSVGLAVLVAVGLLVFLKKKQWHQTTLIWGSLILFGISVFLMIDASLPVWELTSKVVAVDYPFRLLLVAVFFASLLSGLVITQIKQKWVGLLLSAGLIAVAVYTNRNHIRVNQYTEIPLQLYIDSEVTTNTFHEYLPLGAALPKEDPKHDLFIEGLSEGAVVESSTRTTRGFDVTVTQATSSTTTLRHFAFPGIQLYVNDQPTKYQESNEGYVKVTLEPGTQQLSLRYEPERSTKIGYAISAVTALTLLYIAFSKSSTKITTVRKKL